MPRPPRNFAPSFQKYDSPFANANEIAVRYGFRSDFPLRERLDAAGSYYQASVRRSPTPRERRERLEVIEGHLQAVRQGQERAAAALALALLRSPAGLSTFAAHVEHCFDRRPESPGTVAVLEIVFTEEQLDAIASAIKRARDPLAAPRQGARGDPALRKLVLQLAEIWREGTGRPTGVTKDPLTHKREGPFPAFLDEIARSLGVLKSTDALSTLHERWAGE